MCKRLENFRRLATKSCWAAAGFAGLISTVVAGRYTLGSPAVAAASAHLAGARPGAVPWSAPRVPRVPRRPASNGGASCEIFCPERTISGRALALRIEVINSGKRFKGVPGHVPPWLEFPGTWCWGPTRTSPTPLLRYVRDGYRGPPALISRIASGAVPGHAYALPLTLSLSHIFDLSVPGKYKVQIAGLGMISNAIRFRILPPRLALSGPALATLKGPVPEFVTAWGKPHDHLQMAAYWRFNPDGSRVVRVRVLFRVVGHTARSIRLCGNPEVDFAKCKVVGPMFKNVHILAGRFARIANRPAPPSAYGHWLVTQGRAMRASARWKRYRTSPGKIYQYWRPMVVNRRYDLSVPGPYTFSARLAKSQLETGTLTVYSFVQPRGYDRPLYEQYLRHGRNHGQ